MADTDTIAGLRQLDRARGSVDVVDFTFNTLTVSGWILHPSHKIKSVLVYMDDAMIGECPVALRPDVAKAFGHIPHAGQSGFTLKAKNKSKAALINLFIVGITTEGIRLGFPWHQLIKGKSSIPVPSKTLMHRVAGTRDKNSFLQTGLNGALQMMDAVKRHTVLNEHSSLLDWGCGCGRVDSFIAHYWPELPLKGCDIDAEATNWCNKNIAGDFYAISTDPPTPFADGAFSIIIASSVMTHLTEANQSLWLREIHRLLVPKGIFVVSVHGTFAASFIPGMLERLSKQEIIDDLGDNTLDGVAPPGYYRATFQTPGYVHRNWLKTFEILEYKEGGLTNFQDLVVLQKRGN